jgi:hypothetical protein
MTLGVNKLDAHERTTALRFLAQALYANPERAADLLRWSEQHLALEETAVLKQALEPVLSEAARDADWERLREKVREVAQTLHNESSGVRARQGAADALYWATTG